MKQFIIILFSFIISSSAFCSDPTSVNFCNNTINTISLTDLLNCNELTVNDATYSIQSLKLGFEANGNYYEQNITGSIIPQTFLTNIQTYSPDKIYIEDIILVDGNNITKPIKGFTIVVTN